MSGFATCIPIVLDLEGGDTHDAGGATRAGMTQGTFSRWLATAGLPERSVFTATAAEVEAAYHRMVWRPAKCEALPWPLSLAHFDSATQHRAAPKLLQRALGVTEDGIIGPVTLGAAAPGRAREIADDLLWVRLHYYTTLSNWPRNAKGWVRRMCKLREIVRGRPS